MYRIILFAVLAMQAICQHSAAKTFDSQSAEMREAVVRSLAHGIDVGSVAIVTRDNGFVRPQDPLFPRRRQQWLGLMQYHWLSALKGGGGIERHESVYLYDTIGGPPVEFTPDGRTTLIFGIGGGSGNEKRIEYTPTLWNYVPVLVCALPCPAPATNYVGGSTGFGLVPDAEEKELMEDARTMPGQRFVEKYGLSEVFSRSVFKVMEGCIFQVEYPESEIPEPTPAQLGPNWDRYNRRKENRAKMDKEFNSLIHLSPREVSEIVFTAYWLEGRDGAAKYAAACTANPAILVPLACPKEFTTEVGKRLFEAVKAKPPAKESP